MEIGMEVRAGEREQGRVGYYGSFLTKVKIGKIECRVRSSLQLFPWKSEAEVGCLIDPL